MTRIKDKPDLAIFTELEKLKPDMKLFTIIGGSDLDGMFASLYSERALIYPQKTSEQYARFLDVIYSKKWDNVFDLMTASESTLAGLGLSREESRKTEEVVNDIDTIAAFNSESFENNTQNDKTRNVTETRTKADKDIRNFKVSYDYLQNNFIIDTVFADAIDLLTCHVM